MSMGLLGEYGTTDLVLPISRKRIEGLANHDFEGNGESNRLVPEANSP